MDELEFRRRVMSDPKARDPELLEATKTSEANAKYLDDILGLDARIEQAMKVDVPDDLADRRGDCPRQDRRQRRRHHCELPPLCVARRCPRYGEHG